ncbi:MAG: 16S rRNA (cytosine(1402)-N(4))-methyltransferase RsmH [Candidatus Omnitrophota bacterium]
MRENYHVSVMSREVFTYLMPQPGQTFVDCTVGCAGHAEQILKAIMPGGRLIGIDQDKEALKIAQDRLKNYGDCLTLVHDNFSNIKNILKNCGVEKVHGILFDLGISSLQIDSKTRGFSFQHDAPLDMRMNQESKITAFDLINNLTEDELCKIIWNYGEDRWARKIARLIVLERRENPIVTTSQLSNIILRAISFKRKEKISPATRTFQALRIAVNRELDTLEKGLDEAIDFLESQARVCVISFHSLDDRIVKRIYRKKAQEHKIKIITKKPLVPSWQEILDNPRSRSAKLRVAEKNGIIR